MPISSKVYPFITLYSYKLKYKYLVINISIFITALLVVKLLSSDFLMLLSIMMAIIAIICLNSYSGDNSAIFIDKLIGIWFAISIINSESIIILSIVFILYIIYDIKKPSIISRLEKSKKPFLIIFTDLITAILAIISTFIILKIYNLIYLD